MEQERRKEGRKLFTGPMQNGLSLDIGGRELRVESVVDVSPLGVGVLVQEEIAVGVPVEVTYRDATMAISWSGITVWSFPRQIKHGDSVRSAAAIGIQLFSPTLLHTLLKQVDES